MFCGSVLKGVNIWALALQFVARFNVPDRRLLSRALCLAHVARRCIAGVAEREKSQVWRMPYPGAAAVCMIAVRTRPLRPSI